jgi:hypothetical protein
MKPTLKAHGSERLKPEHEEVLSNFAFESKLRRSTKEMGEFWAGAYTRPLFSSTRALCMG